MQTTKTRTQLGVRIDQAMAGHLVTLRKAWTGPTGTPDDSAIVREALRRAATSETVKGAKDAVKKMQKNPETTLDIV